MNDDLWDYEREIRQRLAEIHQRHRDAFMAEADHWIKQLVHIETIKTARYGAFSAMTRTEQEQSLKEKSKIGDGV